MNGKRAAQSPLVVGWKFTDIGEEWTVRVSNGAMSTVRGRIDDAAQATITTARATLDSLILQELDPVEAFSSGAIAVEGDGMALGSFLGLLEDPDPDFPIVTPRG